MEINTLFTKMAQGAPLNSLELEKLRLWGNTVQANDEYIKSLQTGMGDVNIRGITSIFGEFRYSPNGLNSFIAFNTSSVATATPTNLTFSQSYWDELRGFTVNATTFRIPFDGKYQIVIFGGWGASAGGGYRQIKIKTGTNFMEEYSSVHSSFNISVSNYVRGEVALRAGSDISVEGTQTSGGNINCSGRMSIRLIRNYDGDIV